jgi:hypothetical protein
MENFINPNSSETLILTKNTFSVLLYNVIQHFKDKHAINARYKDSQLYGFGSYTSEKPNLKSDLEQILKGYVNGKYLYNKHRESQLGIPINSFSLIIWATKMFIPLWKVAFLMMPKKKNSSNY